MALEDDQRLWLNTALSGKGWIKSAGIKHEFENYKRRREKVQTVFEGLPTSHVNHMMISAGLGQADKLAKAGEFKAAYKSLDQVKALAKVTDASKAGDILETEVRQTSELVTKLVSAQVDDVDRYIAKMNPIKQRFADLAPCSAETSLEDAIERRKAITALEPAMLGDVEAMITELDALRKRMNERKIRELFSSIAAEFTRLNDAGHGAIVQSFDGAVSAAETLHDQAGGKYNTINVAQKAQKGLRVDCEKLLLDRKSLETFKTSDFQLDAKTQNAQSDLRERTFDEVFDDVMREEARLELARKQYLEEVERDRAAMAKTGTVDLELAPPPPEFNADDILDVLTIDPDGKLKSADRAQAATQAGQKISQILQDPATPQSVLLDLMSKDLNAIGTDIFQKLYPGLSWTESSDKQQDLVTEMANEMLTKINSDAPNKTVKSDDPDAPPPGIKEVSVGGVTYTFDKLLKAGGLGTACLFIDPISGKKMVMKTPLADAEEAFDDLLKEMKTMNRVQEGAALGPNASPAPEFYGAARGEDGSTHCLMEYVDGGDLQDVGKALNAAADSGFLPEAARSALQADMVGKTAKALAELQRQGLLHHDIKALNVMMTKDGDIRIIDYGESAFVKADGTADRDDIGNYTAGYIGDDGFGDDATVEADTFALGSMLMDMVSQTSNDKRNTKDTSGGALGRLVTALHADPGERISLEGMAQSAFMTSTEHDFGSEVMDELRAAATAFAQDAKSLKTDKTYAELHENLGDFPIFGHVAKPDKQLGIDDLQKIMQELQGEADDIYRSVQNNPDKLTPEQLAAIPENKREAAQKKRDHKWFTEQRDQLTKLTKAQAYLQTQVIDTMMDKAIADADVALNDETRTFPVTVMGQTKTLNIKQAVEAHADLVELIDHKRRGVVKWLEDATGAPDAIEADLAGRNEELVAINAEAETLQDQIETAAGPAARIKFSKARMDAASVPFGPAETRRTQDEIERDELEEMLAVFEKYEITEEIKEMAEPKTD